MIRSRMIDRRTVQYDNLMNLTRTRKGYVKVGFPTDGDIAFGDRVGSEHAPVNDMADLAMIAAVHEYGRSDGTIPARPFMRPSFDQNIDKLHALRERLWVEYLNGHITNEQAFGLMGEFLVAKIKNTIRRIREPALAPATIARKHSSKPLIDTGQMLNSVQYKVVV